MMNSGRGLGPSRLHILVDGSLTLFADRLIHSMNDPLLEIEKLPMPKRKVAFLKWVWNLKKSKAGIVHYLWGHYHPLFYIVPKLLGKKVVVHWIGTDVLRASEKSAIFSRLFRRIVWRMVDLHLAVSASLAEELRTLGIEAAVIPLVSNMPLFKDEDIPWPSANKVHVYLPETRQEFYGSDTVFRLAREMTDIEFLITAHSGQGAPQLPNLKYLGWVDDMEAVWREVKVYLRLTKHDGLPQSLIEALTRGRYVIWSFQFPHCLKALSFEEAREALTVTLRHSQANAAGIAYARREFEPSKLAQNLKRKYLQLVS